MDVQETNKARISFIRPPLKATGGHTCASYKVTRRSSKGIDAFLKAGAEGFRDFPSLTGSEGESQWQLPDPACHFDGGIVVVEGSKMQDSSSDLNNTQYAVQNVIDNLIDSQEALQQIGERLHDEVVKHFFLAGSLRRAEFRGELETILHREGVRDIDENETIAGTVHRIWARLKSTLGGGDHSLLSTAEAIEDGVYEAYEAALSSNLPLSTREVLRAQAAHVKLSHDYVRAARDHTEAA